VKDRTSAAELANAEAEALSLGDGLVLQHATIDDIEGIAECYSEVMADRETGEANLGIMEWTRVLMGGGHPTARASHFTLVEDTATGQVASACGYIPQRWSYDGVEFNVGRPEIVATRDAYRRRGLVRAQFDLLHKMGERRGDQMLIIDGIHWYYRQFGYELALERPARRSGNIAVVPALPEGESEPVRVRDATEADIPFLSRMYGQTVERSLIGCLYDYDAWRFVLNPPTDGYKKRVGIIERPDGNPVGIVVHDSGLGIHIFELAPGVSWLTTTPSVLRGLADSDRQTYSFWVQSDHPVFEAIPHLLPESSTQTHETWYVRVPDVTSFIRTIKPVLERRLAESVAVGHTGELQIGFYTDGVRLRFDDGRLTEVERWKPGVGMGHDHGFPGLTFVQLLMGYRSLAELCTAFADCAPKNDVSRVLLDVLFPKRPSFVWSIA
jgi:hypothetical protein